MLPLLKEGAAGMGVVWKHVLQLNANALGQGSMPDLLRHELGRRRARGGLGPASLRRCSCVARLLPGLCSTSMGEYCGAWYSDRVVPPWYTASF